MAKRWMLAATVAALLLAGCGSSGGDAKATGDATTTAASGSSGGSSGKGSCGSHDGEKGVIRSFCDGPASMTFTIDGKEGTIGGGTCEESGGSFVLNAGTVVGTDFAGSAKPDYAGLVVPAKVGAFDATGATVTITADGKAHVVRDVSGTRTATSGSFEGTDFDGGGKISGTWTC